MIILIGHYLLALWELPHPDCCVEKFFYKQSPYIHSLPERNNLFSDIIARHRLITENPSRKNMPRQLTSRQRYFIDIFCILVSPALSSTLRFDGPLSADLWPRIATLILLALLLQLPIFWTFGFYAPTERRSGLRLGLHLLAGGLTATGAVTLVFIGLQRTPLQPLVLLPRTIPVFAGLLSLTFLSLARLTFPFEGPATPAQPGPNRPYPLYLAIVAWAILYLSYVFSHAVPVNPAGFYVESARQLAENAYRLPEFVRNFGDPGIPFAYPPLSFYLLALFGHLFGAIHTAALVLPGLLLLGQAIAAYAFMRAWRGAGAAAGWAAAFLLLTPHMVFRTLYADGITTGLAGIFIFLAWRQVIAQQTWAANILSGLFVGLAILSHPALGFFGTVSFVILYCHTRGLRLPALRRLVLIGAVSLLVILPWLLTVVGNHGLAPFWAGLQDGKSSTALLTDSGAALLDIYNRHFADRLITLSLLIFFLPVAALFSLLRGPTVILALFLAGLLTFKSHPSVSILVLSLSVGIFFGDVLLPACKNWLIASQATWPHAKKLPEMFFITGFSLIFIGLMFGLDLPYTRVSTFSPGEFEIYDWVRTQTDPDAVILMDGLAENLVYFGERQIIFPVLGAEWLPSQEYGNGLLENAAIKKEIFACRQIDCLLLTLEQHQAAPDYLVIRWGDDAKNRWIADLGRAPQFDLAFESESFVVLHYDPQK